MTEPTVTCIIPVKNGERYLAQAIESALAEPIAELIVVVERSEDRTLAVAKSFRESRVCVVEQSVFSGVSNARNEGVRRAEGEYVAFLDADDIWLPDKTRSQTLFIEDSTGPVLASCDTDQFLEPGCAMPGTIRRDKMGVGELLVPSTLLCRRDLFALVGGFEPGRSFAEDVDWYNRAFRLGVLRVHVPRVLVRKRVHGESASQRNVATAAELGRMQAEIGHVLSREVVPRMFPVI